MIDLHYWPTPNGKKVTILLEEAGIPYNIIPVNIGRGDQFTPEFLKMNPNHRMPVMVDTAPAGGGEPIAIFESGAIMLYLAEKVGRFYPQDVRGKYAVTEWLIWQMANQGPKLGECGHFRRLGDKQGDQSYAVRRFTDEANRLYGVHEQSPVRKQVPRRRRVHHRRHDLLPVDGELEGPRSGHRGIQVRASAGRKSSPLVPAVQRGMAVGADLSEDPSKLPPEEQERRARILYNQRARPVPAQ